MGRPSLQNRVIFSQNYILFSLIKIVFQLTFLITQINSEINPSKLEDSQASVETPSAWDKHSRHLVVDE